MKLFFKFLLYFLLFNSLYALDKIEHETSVGTEAAYFFDDHSGFGQNGGFLPPDYIQQDAYTGFPTAPGDQNRSLGSGWGSAKCQFFINHSIEIPFLVGENSLTEDNNVTFDFRLNVSPVTLYLKSSALFTPVAFLEIELGGMIGSGWNASVFNGLGLNTTGIPETDSFPGLVTELWSSAKLQFDLGVILPGKWSHLLLVANWELKFSYFSEADDFQPWQWLGDDGENLNGVKFNGTYFIGYKMPLLVDIVGFLFETSQHLGDNRTLSTMDSGGWGSDFVELSFGPLVNFTFDKHHSLTTLFQFQTGRDYSDNTIFNANFINREYEDTYVRMYRLAFSYKYKF